jgi:hypothetical protein
MSDRTKMNNHQNRNNDALVISPVGARHSLHNNSKRARFTLSTNSKLLHPSKEYKESGFVQLEKIKLMCTTDLCMNFFESVQQLGSILDRIST